MLQIEERNANIRPSIEVGYTGILGIYQFQVGYEKNQNVNSELFAKE